MATRYLALTRASHIAKMQNITTNNFVSVCKMKISDTGLCCGKWCFAAERIRRKGYCTNLPKVVRLLASPYHECVWNVSKCDRNRSNYLNLTVTLTLHAYSYLFSKHYFKHLNGIMHEAIIFRLSNYSS